MMPFQTEFEVRDYECDLQGVVNNAEYFHYFEHARHLFCRDAGLNFAALHAEGIDLVAVRAEIDYRQPLRSGDRFAVTVELERVSKLRWAFLQQLLLGAGERKMAAGRFIVTSLRHGRPALVEMVVGKLEEYLRTGA